MINHQVLIGHLRSYVLFVAAILFPCQPVVSQDVALLESIRNSWAKQEAAAKTVGLRLIEESTESKGVGWSRPEAGAPGYVPESREHIVKIDGDKFIHRSHRIGNDDSKDRIESSVESFDGVSQKSFATFGDAKPSGASKSGSVKGDYRQAILFPIFGAFRPVHPLMGIFELENAEAVDESAKVGPYNCIVLRSKGDRTSNEVWISPQLDFLPLRFVHNVDQRKSMNLEITYQQKDGAQVPISWKYDAWLANGDLYKSSKLTVLSIELNGAIPHKDFVVDFPQDTLVYDADTRKK